MFLKLPEKCKILKLEFFLLMTYVEKTSYFEVALPCHTMLSNTLIIDKKKKSMYPNLFYSGLKISDNICLRNVQNFF